MSIFISTPGKVAIVSSKGTVPGAVTLPSTVSLSSNGERLTKRVIITGVAYEQNAHVQFQQSLLNAIYLNSFGDKMGAVQISGIAFSESCNDTGSTGVEDILKYYATNRVSNDNKPITVLIGKKPITGYLVSCKIQTQSVEHLTYGFVLNIAALPAFLDK